MNQLMGAVQMMSSLEIAELTGKNHFDVLRDIRKMLVDLELGESSFAGSYFSEQNKEMPLFNLDREHTDCLLTGYSAKARMLVIKRWHELEAKQAPVPRTKIEWMQAAIDAEKAKEVALLLANHAIATKSEIGTRREATAMNTASQAVKRANQLEVELDQSKQYSTIKRMEMLHHGIKFKWRLLKSAGLDLGIESKEVFDTNYGSVKAYHADVWLEAYALSIQQEAA